MSKPTVFIIYGFAEGPWQGRLFRRQLGKYGWVTIDEVENADIVIAHSGGCFYLPEPRKDQLTVLINPPYWPDKSLLRSGLESAWHNFAVLLKAEVPTGFWLKKTAWNAFYVIVGIRKTLLIAVNARRRKFYLALKQCEVLLIRSEHDPWLSPDTPQLLRGKARIIWRKAPGWHDHCWLYPDKYVEMIKSVYESR